MDDKPWGRKKRAATRRRPLHLNISKQSIKQFIQTSKGGLLTVTLLAVMMVLLFALAIRLPAPAIDTTPINETAVGYNEFLQQVKAGNVQAVVIKGDELDALLKKPLDSKSSGSTQQNAAANYALWRHDIGVDNTLSAAASNSSQDLNPAQALYTHLPAGGDASLVPQLLTSHVTVNTLAVSQTSRWLNWLLKLLDRKSVV